MACIDVHINNAVDEHLSVSAALVGHGLKVNVSPWKSASASLEAFVSRIGGELKAYLSDTIKSHLAAGSSIANSFITARCSVVCSVGKNNDGREIFMVKEGVFLLEDGETFRVIKEDGWLSE